MSTGTAGFTGITIYAGALATALLALTGAAILRPGPAAAGTSQDDQFLALLDQEGIPALEGVPNLIDTAHKVCRAIDAGYSAGDVINAMVEFAYTQDPAERQYAPGRLARTEARFITAAVTAYCPYDQGKIASIAANPASDWNTLTHQGVASARNAVNSGSAVLQPRAAAVPSGIVTQPDPPEIPAVPPVAHLAPPQPIAAPPRPQQAAPRPQQPAPRPQQVAPAPQAPAPPPPQPAPPPPPPPPPAPPMSPGFVRLAP